MKVMKKIVWIIMATAMVFTFCFGVGAKEVTLTVTHGWYGGDAHAPFTKWAFTDFQEKYPDIKLKINEIPAQNVRDKVRTNFAGGVANDIVLYYGGAESYPFVQNDLLLDITDVVEPLKESFLEGILKDVTYNGKIYGLPSCQNFFALYVNRDIYKQYGFDYPKTYQELLDQVIKFKENGLIPIMLPGQGSPAIQHFYSFIANQTTQKGEFEKASYGLDGHTYTDEGFVKAAEIIVELQENGAFDPNVDGIPMASAEQMFAAGQGAMYFAGIWRVGSLPEDIRSKMHPILFPEVVGYTENPNIATGQTEMAWLVNSRVKKDKDKYEAAIKFIKYMAEKEVSEKHVNLTDTVIPVVKNVDTSGASYAVKKSIELARNAEFRPFLRYYQTPAQGNATKELGWDLITGRGTVESCLNKLENIPKNTK